MSLVTRLSRSPRGMRSTSRSGRRLSFSSTSVRRRDIVRCTIPARMYACSHCEHRRDDVEPDGEQQRAVQLVAVDAIRARAARRRSCSSPRRAPVDRVTRSTTLAGPPGGRRPRSRRPSTRRRQPEAERPSPGSPPTSRPVRPSHRATASDGVGRRLAEPPRGVRGLEVALSSLTTPPAPSGTRRSRRTSGTSRAAPRGCRVRPAVPPSITRI